MNAKEAVDYLVQEGYVASNRSKKLIFTEKWYAENGIKEGAITAIAVRENKVGLSLGHIDWESYFMNFIMACEIPRDAVSGDGGVYTLNAYSKEGMKAFQKAMHAGIKYEGLVACTKLYYQSKVKMKLAIGKYMASEAWRTGYLELAQAIQSGTVEKHIKQTTQTNGRTSYRVG